ncbi:hypothetical protein [Bradyrhizobium sp. 23AC]
MPRDNLLLIVFDNVRMRVSFYRDLHCARCHIPEVYRDQFIYRDQFKRLMGLSQFSLEEMTALTCRSCLRNVPVTGDDQAFNIVFLRVVAIAHANKQGLQVQNPGGLGPLPIADVTSIFDDRERLTFLLSFDRAEGETLDRFRGWPSVWALVLRRKAGAVNGLASVQARMTVNRRNLSEAPDAYLGLSSIGIDPFGIKPMFATRRHTQQAGYAFVALPSLQSALPRPRSSCSSRLPDRRAFAGQGTSCESALASPSQQHHM